jgi:hypothetical protein
METKLNGPGLLLADRAGEAAVVAVVAIDVVVAVRVQRGAGLGEQTAADRETSIPGDALFCYAICTLRPVTPANRRLQNPQMPGGSR